MLLIVKEPFAEDRLAIIPNGEGRTLDELLGAQFAAIGLCLINGELREDWRRVCPTDERIEIFPRVGVDPVTWGTTLAPIINALIATAIATTISLGTSLLMQALAKKVGRETGSPEQIFGIAGLTNTVALGTSKLLPYGTRRVFGHLISSMTSPSQTGSIQFAALYLMGKGEVDTIDSVEINNTPIASFAGVTFDTRTGTAGQAIVSKFDVASQVYHDGRTLPMDPSTITYTTNGTDVDHVIMSLFLPFLFNVENKTGRHTQTKVAQRIEYRVAGSGAPFIDAFNPDTWSGLNEGNAYRFLTLSFASKNQWEIRLRALPVSGGTNESNQQAALFNVDERSSGVNAYPNNALLAVYGIASEQLTSFESMRVSARVKGLKVKIWNGVSFTTAWTDNRAWIVRDLLTHPTRGLGNRIPESFFDDDAALTAANYWDTLVPAFTGTEKRDRCDVLVNERRPGWDWVKEILGEGRATIIPSGGKLKIVFERDASPNLLYSMPGNVIEGSLSTTWGTGEGDLPNTYRGEFPNGDKADVLDVIELIASDIDTEPTREELVSFRTLTRESQVIRELAYQLKRRRLVKRRYSWKSPSTALVSEPLDVDSLSYLTVNARRGFSGVCPSGSTTTTLILDRLVTLDAATTYELILRHLADNTVERKVVATAAGTWGLLAPTVAFATAPAEGDVWAIGKQSTAIVPVRIESVKNNDDGTWDLQASEYVSAVYDLPTLGSKPSTRRPPLESGLLPLPLESVTVTATVEFGADGTAGGRLVLQVVPGLPSHAGTAQAGGTLSRIILSADEPTVDDYFEAVAADCILTGGTGSGQTRRILSYHGSDRIAVVFPDWDTAPDGTTRYQIDWQTYDAFAGFDVELRETGATDFTFWQSFPGTLGVLTSVTVPFSGDMRFTPYSVKQARNTVGRWTKSFSIAADTTPPGAPNALTVISYQGFNVLTWTNPTDLDFAFTEVWSSETNDRATAVHLDDVPSGVASYKDFFGSFGSMAPILAKCTLAQTTLGGGRNFTLFYWIRAKDTSKNVSAWYPVSATGGVQADAFMT